jgi:hypothetical protein
LIRVAKPSDAITGLIAAVEGLTADHEDLRCVAGALAAYASTHKPRTVQDLQRWVNVVARYSFRPRS